MDPEVDPHLSTTLLNKLLEAVPSTQRPDKKCPPEPLVISMPNTDPTTDPVIVSNWLQSRTTAIPEIIPSAQGTKRRTSPAKTSP